MYFSAINILKETQYNKKYRKILVHILICKIFDIAEKCQKSS
jgi:hypothetical protein